MQLKPAGKLVIVLLLVVIGFFVYKKYSSQSNQNKTGDYSTTTTSTSNNTGSTDNERSNNENTTRNTNSGNTERREFNYTPEKPVNGILRGVVEVGATGFNSFVINMDKEKRWEIVSKDFGESLAYEGLATTEDIRLGLKRYLSSMFDKGVTKNNMHF